MIIITSTFRNTDRGGSVSLPVPGLCSGQCWGGRWCRGSVGMWGMFSDSNKGQSWGSMGKVEGNGKLAY